MLLLPCTILFGKKKFLNYLYFSLNFKLLWPLTFANSRETVKRITENQKYYISWFFFVI